MMRRLNIRWRLTLWFGAAMTALLVVRSFWIYVMMERRLNSVAEAELQVELEALEDEIASAATRTELQELLARIAASRRELGMTVSTPAGDVLFRHEPGSRTPRPRSSPRRSGQPSRIVSRISADGATFHALAGEVPSPVGQLAVELIRSTEAKRNEAWDFAVTLLTTGPLVVLAAMGVGFFVSARALNPVDTMISAAKHITARRLDQRIDVPDTGDELARLAQTLNEMIDRLHNSFEEMRRFTADAAHDLRTPVAALRTEVEVSLMADHTVEEYRRSMQTVLDEAIHLSRLTGQLLDLSREDHGIAPQQAEPVRLDAIIRDAMDDLRTAAQQKQITVDAGQIRPWTVPGDQVRLRRVFMNLLDNAIQYTAPGGKVWIEGDFSPEQATVVVADNGPGVPAEDLPHIFDRFRRVDKARNRQMGGTGLGLAICKSIVNAHGGDIVMESRVGSGTRVRVTLPAGRPATQTASGA